VTLHNNSTQQTRRDTKKTLTEDFQDRWSIIITGLQKNYRALLNSLPDSLQSILAEKMFVKEVKRMNEVKAGTAQSLTLKLGQVTVNAVVNDREHIIVNRVFGDY